MTANVQTDPLAFCSTQLRAYRNQYKIFGISVDTLTIFVDVIQIAWALVEFIGNLVACLNKWTDPMIGQMFSLHNAILISVLLIGNQFFAVLLTIGILYENCGMAVANLGWMTLMAVYRLFYVIHVINYVVTRNETGVALIVPVICVATIFLYHCLACCVVARCACYFRKIRVLKRKQEILTETGLFLVHLCGQTSSRAPPPYTTQTLPVPDANESNSQREAPVTSPMTNVQSEAPMTKDQCPASDGKEECNSNTQSDTQAASPTSNPIPTAQDGHEEETAATCERF